jgi:hypothetical protein
MELVAAGILGIASGLGATVPMTLAESFARRIGGPAIVLDWIQNEATAARLWRSHPEARVPLGLTLHFLHGAVAGMLFFLAIALVESTVPLWALALAYGLILWILSLSAFRRTTGSNAWAGTAGFVAILVSLVAHLIFAASLGAFGAVLSL